MRDEPDEELTQRERDKQAMKDHENGLCGGLAQGCPLCDRQADAEREADEWPEIEDYGQVLL
jgi:hypothetical protein